MKPSFHPFHCPAAAFDALSVSPLRRFKKILDREDCGLKKNSNRRTPGIDGRSHPRSITLKEPRMRSKAHTLTIWKLLTASFAIVWALGSVLAANTASADTALHLQKDCTEFVNAMGVPGSYCKIVFSTLTKIPPGSKLFYDQGAGALTSTDGAIDSN